MTGERTARVVKLTPHHRDLFDRFLVAQSLVEQLVLLTPDSRLAGYGSLVRVV